MTADPFDARDGMTAGTAGPQDEGALEQERLVVRDRRRLDPETGAVRERPSETVSGPDAENAAREPDTAAPDTEAPDTATTTDSAAEQVPDDGSDAGGLADELRTDLRRLQAEYVNYRRRVDRDRDVAREAGAATVLEALVPVLDDIHFAREHGDLAEGPFAAIADKLEAVLGKFGFERYGETGEPFDPAVHEALMHSHSADVTETTVVQVLQPGYRQGGRVLRAARVAVADPE